MNNPMHWIGQVVAVGAVLSLTWSSGAIAQSDVLTQAEVYRLRNAVQLLLRNQPPRPARLSDVLRPLDALRTANTAIAELLFNEGSIARVDQNTTFRFETGLRRFQLPNRIALNETIFILENGTALVMSPPNGVGTQVRTPDSVINIIAPVRQAAIPPATASTQAKPMPTATHLSPQPPLLSQTETTPGELLPPPDRSSAVMVSYEAARGFTQVFALTNGDITVADAMGQESVALQGGQTVVVREGELGPVQEFDLQTFYRSVALAAGLGPGQDEVIAQEPASVQTTLTAVRIETLAAIRTQARRLASFSTTFLQDALNGSDSDFDGFRGEPSVTILNPTITLGTFQRTGDNTAIFTDVNNNQVPISIDFDDRTISINGNSGVSSSAGLSGNNAAGTVVLRNGQVIRIEVFGVNGEEPAIGQQFPGRIITGIEPDR